MKKIIGVKNEKKRHIKNAIKRLKKGKRKCKEETYGNKILVEYAVVILFKEKSSITKANY